MEHLASWYTQATNFVREKLSREEGASLVEYALLVALIAVVCIVAITFLGERASDKFSEIGSGIE